MLNKNYKDSIFNHKYSGHQAFNKQKYNIINMLNFSNHECQVAENLWFKSKMSAIQYL